MDDNRKTLFGQLLLCVRKIAQNETWFTLPSKMHLKSSRLCDRSSLCMKRGDCVGMFIILFRSLPRDLCYGCSFGSVLSQRYLAVTHDPLRRGKDMCLLTLWSRHV